MVLSAIAMSRRRIIDEAVLSRRSRDRHVMAIFAALTGCTACADRPLSITNARADAGVASSVDAGSGAGGTGGSLPAAGGTSGNAGHASAGGKPATGTPQCPVLPEPDGGDHCAQLGACCESAQPETRRALCRAYASSGEHAACLRLHDYFCDRPDGGDAAVPDASTPDLCDRLAGCCLNDLHDGIVDRISCCFDFVETGNAGICAGGSAVFCP